jgi:putative DNA primase/helicase
MALWRASCDPRGTIVEPYLRSRCLELPDEAAFEAIRFHPNCPFEKERYPAMICLVSNILNDEQQAIHRTALGPNGEKVERDGKTFRLTLGPIAGGAVKLSPNEDVALGLCVGEGVETCLAGLLMGLRPVWSLLNTGGITNFPVLPGIEGLHILRERDDANERAFRACAERWHAAGREVVSACPESGKDINDELRSAAS